MRRPSPRRRAVAATASGALASLAVMVGGADPAEAQTSTVTVPYRCVTTLFGVGYDTLQTVQVSISSPSDAPVGPTFSVTYDLPAGAPGGVPVTLTHVVLQAKAGVSAQVHTGGAATTSTGTGAVGAPVTVAANAPFAAPLPVTVAVPTAGYAVGDRIDLRPDTLEIDILSGDDDVAGGSMLCAPEPSAPVATYVGMANTVPADPLDSCVAQPGDTTGPPGCATDQQLDAEITAGTLSQAASVTGGNPNDSTVDFGSTTTSAEGAVLTAPLNTVTVTDTRGGLFGWSLVATLSPLTGAASGLTIAPANVGVTGLSCTGDASSAPSTAGPGGSFGSTQTLCTVAGGAQGPNDSSGGVFDVGGTLALTVPAFQTADTYSGVVTITLS